MPTSRRLATASQSYEFDGILRQLTDTGWVIFLSPILRCVDDTWTLRRRNDRLDYLFVSETGEWHRWRFTREPFGDYTIPFEDKGRGVGFDLMLKSVGK
jgi:hypothetical protein